MRLHLRALSLILCFELILGPYLPTLIQSANAQDTAESCASRPGTTWNSQSNRCEVSKQVVNTNQAVERCMGLTDKVLKQKCYEQNAKDQLEQGIQDGKAQNNKLNVDKLATTGSATAIAVPLFFLTYAMFKKKKQADGKTKAKRKCNPTSLLLMYAGAGVLALGEVITYVSHHGKLKGMKENWKKIETGEESSNKDKARTQATEAQSQAFEFLAQNEDSLGKVAKTKKIYYGIATGLFAAGTTVAIMETVQWHKAKTTLKTSTNAGEIYAAKEKLDKLTCETTSQKHIKNGNKQLEKIDKTNFEEWDKANKKSYFHFNDYKYLNIARQNVLNSKNLYEAMEMLKEYENIEIEPYSRVSYDKTHEEDVFKSVKIDPTIAQILLNEIFPIKTAHAIPASCSATLPCIEGEICTNGLCLPDNGQNYPTPSTTTNNSGNSNGESGNNAGGNIVNTATNVGGTAANLLNNKGGGAENGGNNLSERTTTTIYDEKGNPIAVQVKETFNAQNIGKVKEEIKKTVELQDGKKLPPEKLKQIENATDDKFTRAMFSPVTRIGINGLLGTWIGIMTAHMSKQQNISEERAALLRKMKGDFQTYDGIAYCKEADRSNTAKPECYCFTSDNKPNPQRSNSRICKNTFSSLYAGQPTQYLHDPMDRVCLDNKDQIDAKCNCRKTNTCNRIGSSFDLKGFNPGTFRMLGSAIAPANDLYNGNISAGSMNSDALHANAARIKGANDKVLAKDPQTKKMSEDVAKKLADGLMAATSGLSMGGMGSMSAGAMPSSPQQAAAELEKELNKNENMNVMGGGGGAVSAAGGPIEDQPEFGLTNDGLAAQETAIAEVMREDMDFGGNDLAGSKANIFEVLSDRYKRSGMRRLFDENGTAPAEPASGKDVHD